MTPLMWAAFTGHTNIVQMLILAGANAQARDNQGMTALMIASEAGHQEVVNILKESENKK